MFAYHLPDATLSNLVVSRATRLVISARIEMFIIDLQTAELKNKYIKTGERFVVFQLHFMVFISEWSLLRRVK